MIDVATIRTATNQYERRVIVALRDGDSVLLDSCPRGTVDVHSYPTAAAAAAALRVSVSTIYRHRRLAVEEFDAATLSVPDQIRARMARRERKAGGLSGWGQG